MTRANQARTAAYRVVRAVLGGDDLPRALAGLRDPLADGRDRALVTELAVGTFRWLAALDHVVGRAADRPVARIDDDVLTVLRLGAYQLLHLDRVPRPPRSTNRCGSPGGSASRARPDSSTRSSGG